ncbi:MAG: hypothetical protein J6K83_07250 [Bacteroidaceae bacterium]|nr:hypothetical protein [Bacteroidaceae bacterium]
MKKNYLMLFCLVLFMAINATAQVSSVADLFGKYKFTATVEYTEAGETYKNQLPAESDVTISEDANYIAKIVGFAGSQTQQNINAISTEKKMLKVTNPNTPQLWNGLYLANINGDNPYGYFNEATSEWEVESYGPVYYSYNPETKEITVPDFTVITIQDIQHSAKGTIIAKYTSVKMTLVEAEKVEVADISGDWNFAAGSGAYDTMEGSVIPTDFSIALTKSGDDNLAYTATIAIEGYNNIELPATFDGNTLALAYDDTYLDEAKGIRFAPMYGSAKKGTIEFKSQSESAFTLYNGFSFASDKMGKTKDETADSLYVNGEYHQWYIAGTLKSADGGSQAFTWDGVWNVKVGNPATDIIKAGTEDISSWPAEFPMHVTYYEATGMYYVDQLFGYDLYGVNQGGLKLTPNADGTATVALDGYYGCAFLKSNGDGTFLQLTNSSGAATNFTITPNEDGSVKIEDLFIQVLDFNTGAKTPVVFYQNMSAVKESAEEPVFDWTGDYKFKAGAVDVYYQDVEFPAEFEVNITYFDGSQYSMDSYYYISSFMGKQLGQSVIKLNIAEDGNSAEMVVGGLCGAIVPGEQYYKIYDMNATDSPVKMTLNEDGTISIANFFIKVMNYNDMSEVAGALYKNAVLVAAGSSSSVENVNTENNVVKGIFDIQGRRIEQITAPGLYIVNGKKILVK